MKNDYTGDWYLPGKEFSLSGKLFINQNLKKITLELYSKIYLTGKSIVYNNFETSDQKQFELINGKSSQKLTLFNCILNSAEPIGESLFRLTYNVEFVLFNIHLNKISELKIYKAEVEYPFLPTFFDGWKSVKDFEDKPEQTTFSNPFQITEKIELKLVDEYLKEMTNLEGGYQLKYTKYIQFEYSKGELFSQVIRDLYKFANILSFATNEHICFNLKTLLIPVKQIESYDNYYSVVNDLYPSHIINFSHNNSCDLLKKSKHQNFMLFSKWTFSEIDLNHLIKMWFENTHLSPIYDFYIDSNNWFKGKSVILSNVMFNNKFLNLVQGLESYYDILDARFISSNEEFTKNRQKVINGIKDKKLEKWIISNLKFPKSPNLIYKLEYLINKFNNIFKVIANIESFIEKYPNDAKEYRHKLSHGRIETTYQGPEFDKLYSFSKILLCFCILESLNIDNNRILKICLSNENLKREFVKITSP